MELGLGRKAKSRLSVLSSPRTSSPARLSLLCKLSLALLARGRVLTMKAQQAWHTLGYVIYYSRSSIHQPSAPHAIRMSSVATPPSKVAHESRAHLGTTILLDLSAEGVKKHWTTQGVVSLINAMERCEPWAVDVQPQFKAQAELVIADMTKRLNSVTAGGLSSSITTDPDVVVEFLGYLRSGRALALFAWLTQAHPSIPKLLVNEARFGGDDFGSILIERITTLERQHLLSRVFSPERIALVLELLAEAGLDSSQ
jgi:hypothetical protein